MTDTLSNVQSIQAWIASVESVSSTLPNSTAGATSPSDFSNLLEQMQSLLNAGPGGQSGQSASPSDVDSTTTASAAAPNFGASLSPTESNVVTAAQTNLGVPYLWGGASPSGFDCSGFVQYVYNQVGIALPRTSEEQATVGAPVASLSDAQPGDLVFFPGTDGTASDPGHVGIYLGNGEMIDAPQTGENVSIQPVGTPVAIRRVLNDPPAQLTSTTAIGTGASSAVPANLAPYFVNAAGTYGVPVQLLIAVARTESNFNPSAVSSAGAEGIMQLTPGTAGALGVNPLDPQQAISGAAQLLSGYLAHFGSVPLALAAYNAGAGAVEQAGGIPPYPQTQAYVNDIMQSLGSSSAAATS